MITAAFPAADRIFHSLANSFSLRCLHKHPRRKLVILLALSWCWLGSDQVSRSHTWSCVCPSHSWAGQWSEGFGGFPPVAGGSGFIHKRGQPTAGKLANIDGVVYIKIKRPVLQEGWSTAGSAKDLDGRMAKRHFLPGIALPALPTGRCIVITGMLKSGNGNNA